MSNSDEREFQLQMVEAQTLIANMNANLTLIIAVSYSMFGVLWAISASIMNSVLSGPLTFTGNFTDGIKNYSGQITSTTGFNITFFSYLNIYEVILGTLGTVFLVVLLIFHFYLTPKRFKEIRRKYISKYS
jgi:hypothetical protein